SLRPVPASRWRGLDDRVIPRPLGVDGEQAPVLPGRVAPPRGALQDQDDLVMRQPGGRGLFLQPTGRSPEYPPPTVRATAYDVGAIDDQDLHSDSLGQTRTRLE